MSTIALRAAALARPRRVRGALLWALVLAIVVVWTVALRPQFLGGPTAVVLVSGTSMEPSLHTGDLVLVHRRPSYRVGDVVAYRVPRGNVGEGQVVIHRIIGGSAESGFVVRGDNRGTDDQWRPKPADIVGTHWADVPTGSPVLAALRSPIGLAALAAAFVFVFVACGSGRRAGDRGR
jgi:signal peptidase I